MPYSLENLVSCATAHSNQAGRWMGTLELAGPLKACATLTKAPVKTTHSSVNNPGSLAAPSEDIKNAKICLAGVAQWIEHQPMNQKVTCLIPSQHMPGLWARSPARDV